MFYVVNRTKLITYYMQCKMRITISTGGVKISCFYYYGSVCCNGYNYIDLHVEICP